MRLKPIALITMIGSVTVLMAGCDLFSTRSTEPPLDQGSPWIPPTQRGQVFDNMRLAILELNSDHYLLNFFDPDDPTGTFLFLPNPNTVGWPLSEPWGYSEEKESIEYLFSLMTPGSAGFLAFDEDQMEELVYGDEDSVRVTQIYNLVVPVSDPTLPQEVRGRSDFYLARTNTGYWAIYRWEDLESLDGLPSWTDLKAGLY